MRKKIKNKKEAGFVIEDFFKNIKDKTPEEIKKVKRLAMKHNLPLKEKRKLFCKYCQSPNLKVLSIKNKVKRVRCKDCGIEVGWKIKQ